MKQFKKRTLTLVLASVITVAGSFAAGNYKNSLMRLNFSTNVNGEVNMSVETKTAYSGNVTPVKRDTNTYMLTLSEMNSMVPQGNVNLEQVSGNIEKVEIKTLPYTNNAKGYTRVIIKTYNPVNIIGENRIFIPSKEDTPRQITSNESNKNENIQDSQQPEKEGLEQAQQERLQREKETREREAQQRKEVLENQTVQSQVQSQEESQPIVNDIPSTESTSSRDAYNVLSVAAVFLLLVCIIAWLSIKAKNKLQEITGERLEIDTRDDEPEKLKIPQKESKRKQIKSAINKLDSAYAKTAVPTRQTTAVSVEQEEDLNVVDLDELFKEKKGKFSEVAGEENNALEDFLSGFSFDENLEDNIPEEEIISYDEEYFEKIINSTDLRFSADEIECIEQILSMEINDDTLKNISKYAVSNPITAGFSRQKFLEELVSTYSISQHISFSQDDVSALKKIVNAELDEDFITDLRTNPERTEAMREEILSAKPRHHKPSEILTLKVKDMLPDLSEALRKQGGKKIESEVKPVTVYASEGYDVNILSLKDSLPDLSAEINKESSYVSKPSADIELVDNSYEVETLHITDSLPDLSKALENPEQFIESEAKSVEIDEEALLKNINNVQFKPFYDGNEPIEILNDFNSPTINEVKNELNQFNNFEITHEEEYVAPIETNKQDDFDALCDEYYDLDNMNRPESEATDSNEANSADVEQAAQAEKEKEVFVPKNLEIKRKPLDYTKRERKNLSEDIMKRIEATRSERLERKNRLLAQKKESETKTFETPVKKQEVKCILEGESFVIVSSVEFSDNKGCHLAKNEHGYTVLGYIDNKLFKLKQFDDLKSERIVARTSEKLPENVTRYIVRIGLNKFIVDVSENNMEYLMAL